MQPSFRSIKHLDDSSSDSANSKANDEIKKVKHAKRYSSASGSRSGSTSSVADSDEQKLIKKTPEKLAAVSFNGGQGGNSPEEWNSEYKSLKPKVQKDSRSNRLEGTNSDSNRNSRQQKDKNLKNQFFNSVRNMTSRGSSAT